MKWENGVVGQHDSAAKGATYKAMMSESWRWCNDAWLALRQLSEFAMYQT
jgi:hypothetical protein